MGGFVIGITGLLPLGMKDSKAVGVGWRRYDLPPLVG
jgi:hypothetical protein